MTYPIGSTSQRVLEKPALLQVWETYDWVFYMFIGAVGIHIMETMYRLHFFTEFFSLRTILTLEPFRIIAGFGLFWGFRTKKASFLMAWAVFILFITVSRVLISFYAAEPFNFEIALGLVLIIAGLYATTLHATSIGETLAGLFLLAVGVLVGGNQLVNVFVVDFMPDWWMGALFASALAIAISEYFARKGSFESFFWKYYVCMLPFSVVINWGLYYGYTYAVPTFMFAWAVYNIYDVVLRIANNALMSEPFRIIHAIGMALIVHGTFLTFVGGVH